MHPKVCPAGGDELLKAVGVYTACDYMQAGNKR